MGKGKFDSSCPEACQDAVVSLPKGKAQCMAILNFIPFTCGYGTMISACLNESGFIYNVFLMGFLQWFTGGLIVGYVWSIMHGLWLMKAAK